MNKEKEATRNHAMPYDRVLGTVFNKFKCFITMHHKPVSGRYMSEAGCYIYKYRCKRCGALLGLPSMTDEYIKEHFPMPKRRKNELKGA